MAKRKKKANRRRARASRLSDHKKSGRRLTPPLLQVGNLQAPSWLKDVFPDLLWICSVIISDQTYGLHRVINFVDGVNAALKERDAEAVADGRLSTFESVPEELHDEILERLINDGVYFEGVPEQTFQLLGQYEDLPGGWIIKPWREKDTTLDIETADRHINAIMEQAWHGQTACSNAGQDPCSQIADDRRKNQGPGSTRRTRIAHRLARLS